MHDNPVLYDMHIHTSLCKHARGKIEEYAEVAHQRGLKGIVVTCHNPTTDGWSPDTRMSMAEFHHVLGAVHPHLKDYKDRYYRGHFTTFLYTYFEHLAMAAETGLFDAIAHPDFVKVVAPSEWNPDRVMDVVCRCLDRIAATGTAMELNTSGLNKIPNEMFPGREILREMQVRTIPLVIGSDAHDPQRVAAMFEDALNTSSAVGYTHTNIILNRKRREIPIIEARQSLRVTV